MRIARLAAPDDFRGLAGCGARADRGAGVAGRRDLAGRRGAGRTVRGRRRCPAPPAAASFSVPRAFLDLAGKAILHREPERFALLYTLLTRLRAEPKLIEGPPPIRWCGGWRAWRRRFAATSTRCALSSAFGSSRMTKARASSAWFEPEHHILRANAGFFVDRFAAMRWSILTPELSIHWDGDTLREGPGAAKGDVPDGDPIEDVWKTYYASIFNPARAKDRRDAEGNAAAILEKHARNGVGTGIDRKRAGAGERHDRAGTDANRRQCCGGMGSASRRGGRLHPLPSLQTCDADGVRRRAGRCGADVRRRAAGRPGGSGRHAVRRPGRPGVRPRHRRGRNRPGRGLRHQCSEAFQVRAARQAPHPSEARRWRDHRPAAGGSSRSCCW